jgi:hypothetical protein
LQVNISRAVSDAWNKFRDLLSGEISRVGKAASDVSREAGSTPARAAANTLEPKDKDLGKTLAEAGKFETSPPPFDAARTANTKVGDDLVERHAIKIYNFDTPGLDTRVVGEFGAGIDDMLTKYPPAGKGLSLSFYNMKDLPETSALTVTMRKGDSTAAAIVFREDDAKNPGRVVDAAEGRVQSGLMNKGHERRPVYYNAVHEFGHVMVNESLLYRDVDSPERFAESVDSADSALRSYYRDKYGEGRDESEVEESYLKWRSKLSGYSFRDGDKNGDIIDGEANAESFVDVEMNGSQASEPAQVLHQRIVESAKMRWRGNGWL